MCADLSHSKRYSLSKVTTLRIPILHPTDAVEVDCGKIDSSFLIPNYHLHLMPTQAVVYPPESKPYWATPGRAINSNTCKTDDDICPIAEASQMMIRLEEKYPGFAVFSLPPEMQKMQNYDKSCGVGRRTIYITSDSVVHLCPMSIGTSIPGFGTVQSHIRSKTPWDNSFSRLIQQVNEPNDRDCSNCQHKSSCACIARGIRQYLKAPENCLWGQRNKLDELLENADWAGI